MKLLIKVFVVVFILSVIALAFSSQPNDYIPSNTIYAKKRVYWQGFGYAETTYIAAQLNYQEMECRKTGSKRFICRIVFVGEHGIIRKTICRFTESERVCWTII